MQNNLLSAKELILDSYSFWNDAVSNHSGQVEWLTSLYVWGVFGECLGSDWECLESVWEMIGSVWEDWGVFGSDWECLGGLGSDYYLLNSQILGDTFWDVDEVSFIRENDHKSVQSFAVQRVKFLTGGMSWKGFQQRHSISSNKWLVAYMAFTNQ